MAFSGYKNQRRRTNKEGGTKGGKLYRGEQIFCPCFCSKKQRRSCLTMVRHERVKKEGTRRNWTERGEDRGNHRTGEERNQRKKKLEKRSRTDERERENQTKQRGKTEEKLGRVNREKRRAREKKMKKTEEE
jgi:hypothetical protein